MWGRAEGFESENKLASEIERKQNQLCLLHSTDLTSFSGSHGPLTQAEGKPKQTAGLVLSLYSKCGTT